MTLCDEFPDFTDFSVFGIARRDRKRGNLQQNPPCSAPYAREIVISVTFDGLGDDWEQSRRSRPLEARRSRAKYLFGIHAEKYGGEAWRAGAPRPCCRARSFGTYFGDVRAYRVSTYVFPRSSYTCVNGKGSLVYKVLACHALYAMYACATSFSLARLTRVT